jgi:hypothetical protein
LFFWPTLFSYRHPNRAGDVGEFSRHFSALLYANASTLQSFRSGRRLSAIENHISPEAIPVDREIGVILMHPGL